MPKVRLISNKGLIALAAAIISNTLFSIPVFAKPLNTLSFSTPSGNIDCVYMESDRDVPSLRCQTAFDLNPLPPKPADCDLDWGGGLHLESDGKVAVVCAGDTIAGDYTPLAYGEAWEKNGLRCVSRRRGLTCSSRNGKGFFLSRQGWKRI
jgi:hypothetical protein